MYFFKKLFYKNQVRTIYLVDILYMKNINATYGFQNGQFVITELYKFLKTEVKYAILKYFNKNVYIEIENTYVDVFSISIYKDLQEKEIIDIKDIIFNLIVTKKFFFKSISTSIDIDITIGSSKGSSDNLIIYAEKALHNAKINYMNYDSVLYKEDVVNLKLFDILQYNIKNQLVEPFFQPICENKTKIIYKYESLMRIFDQDGTILNPYSFIEEARKYRLFNKLMELMIKKVILYVKEYKINVSINLDYDDISNPSIKQLIIDNVKENNLGKYITIEILESKKITNYSLVNDFIKKLKEFDIKIAIDDFGSGFSNYEHILNINTDYIKVDGSLVQKFDEKIYYNLLKSIVIFCKQQNIKVVAEFVKDLKTFRYVKSLDIEYSQGYYIGMPMPIKDVLEKRNEKTINRDN